MKTRFDVGQKVYLFSLFNEVEFSEHTIYKITCVRDNIRYVLEKTEENALEEHAPEDALYESKMECIEAAIERVEKDYVRECIYQAELFEKNILCLHKAKEEEKLNED